MRNQTIIVGAGLAGLALADRLVRAGHDCLVLEARDRIGGRILTHESAGRGFDLGPAWFWPGQPRMAALADRLGLAVFEQGWQGDAVMETADGVIRRGRSADGMRGSLRFEGGMVTLANGLARGLLDRVRLSSRVEALRYDTHSVAVSMVMPDGPATAQADRVVLALPPRVAAGLAFAPHLPDQTLETLSAIPTWMAGHAKILGLYDRPHWRDRGLSGDAFSHKGPMVELHDASPQQGGPFAIFGFVGVPVEMRLADHDRMTELARAQLVRLFGPEMARPRALILQDWAQESATATVADHLPLMQHPAYGCPPFLSDLWDGRLMFGSTEMAPSFGGYLEGALERAELLSGQILQPDR